MKEIFWINGGAPPHITIVLRLRGDDWLDAEMQRLKEASIDALVSMLEPLEAESLGLAEEEQAARTVGIDFISFPIPDRCVPEDLTDFRHFIDDLVARLLNGERIGVHCRGCIGRSSIVVASALIHLGWDPQAALVAIAHARGTVVPDTPEQESWILHYEAQG